MLYYPDEMSRSSEQTEMKWALCFCICRQTYTNTHTQILAQESVNSDVVKQKKNTPGFSLATFLNIHMLSNTQ